MRELLYIFLFKLFGASSALLAETFIVQNILDSGPGSLRSAIIESNLTMESDYILFSQGEDGSVDFSDGTTRSISLLSPLNITAPIHIKGPGRNLLVVSGQNSVRVFALSGSTQSDPHRIESLTLENGESTLGGANVRVFGSCELINCCIRGGRAVALNGNGNNTQNADGGGVFHSGGHLLVDSCTIEGNRTVGGFSQGGGIYTEAGTATIRNSRIVGNTTNGSVAEGGGIGSRSVLLLENCEITENETLNRSSGGGGVYASNSTVLRQCTLSLNIVGRNTGISGYSVGGAFANVAGTATFEHCTITQNSAPTGMGQGAGISSISSGTLSFYNCIVSGNENSDLDETPNLRLNYRDDGFNLFGSVTNTNLNNVANRQSSSVYGVSDPELSSLDFYGGNTRCHVPLLGSPAIDLGPDEDEVIESTVTDYDQRGIDFLRQIGVRLDRGSAERQIFIDTDSDGLPDAVESLVLGLSSSSGDLDQDGASDRLEYEMLGIAAILDPALKPSLAIRSTQDDDVWRLSFPHSINREYRILSNSDLVSDPSPEDETFQSFRDQSIANLDVISNGPRAFYFLQVRTPDEPTE